MKRFLLLPFLALLGLLGFTAVSAPAAQAASYPVYSCPVDTAALHSPDTGEIDPKLGLKLSWQESKNVDGEPMVRINSGNSIFVFTNRTDSVDYYWAGSMWRDSPPNSTAHPVVQYGAAWWTSNFPDTHKLWAGQRQVGQAVTTEGFIVEGTRWDNYIYNGWRYRQWIQAIRGPDDHDAQLLITIYSESQVKSYTTRVSINADGVCGNGSALVTY